MRGGSVAKRYSTALLRVAQDNNHLAAVGKDLDKLTTQVAQNAQLKEALESPVVAPSKKKGIFLALQDRLKLGLEVKNLMLVLIDRERVDILHLLNLIFRDMADEALGQVRVHVRVAASLGKQEAVLLEVLEKALGLKVLLEVIEDPGIIGGLVVQVGDKIFDGSLKKELEGIKKSIVQKAVA